MRTRAETVLCVTCYVILAICIYAAFAQCDGQWVLEWPCLVCR